MQAIYATPTPVEELRAAVNERLDSLVPVAHRGPQRVNDAVRYALLAPGKRIRPLLTLLAAVDFGAAVEDALDVACATEMVHTASLVLDDLPCMDNARLRRGQPTVHVHFDESTAILAAVALLNQAFATLTRATRLPCETRLALVERLAAAVGFDGLITGQDYDLHDRSSTATVARLEALNHQKTSVLFEAALEIGARVAGAEDRSIEKLRQVAAHLGLAYQIADDLFDVSVSVGPKSKDVHKDDGKPTVVSILGAERARERFGHHMAEALKLLPTRGSGGQPLRDYILVTFAQTRLC
ncbi:MAG: polyprenyl synthetase family protein [Janthinobacterium lividum]